MVDKNASICIIIDTTPFNSKFGKKPGTGTNSHFLANSTKYFGFGTIRRIASLLFNGVVTSNSNRCSNSADSFFINQKETTPASTGNTDQGLTDNRRSASVMANDDFNISSLPVNLGNLSKAELSVLLDLVTHQIEYHRDELTRLKPILHRLQKQIPNQPFADFINELEL